MLLFLILCICMLMLSFPLVVLVSDDVDVPIFIFCLLGDLFIGLLMFFLIGASGALNSDTTKKTNYQEPIYQGVIGKEIKDYETCYNTHKYKVCESASGKKEIVKDYWKKEK